MRYVFLFLAIPLLSACVTDSESYLADGTAVHDIACGDASLTVEECLKDADKICGAWNNYTIYDNKGDVVPLSISGELYKPETRTLTNDPNRTPTSVFHGHLLFKCKPVADAPTPWFP
jgi:hypothetical protein